MMPKDILDIQAVRQCLHYLNFRCDNKYCKNKRCPLNHFWEEIENIKKKEIKTNS